MNINLPRKVKVVPYIPDWPTSFHAEAGAIRSLLREIIIDIHHIGSTSMPGAAAKPIIDIMPVVTDIDLVDTFNNGLSSIGYVARGEYGITGRRFFTKDTGGERSNHLHVFQAGHPEITRHLAFRDYLVAHPVELESYCRLKTELAQQHSEGIEAYMDGKDAFIKEIDRKAAAERSSTQSSLPQAILLLGPTGAGKTPLGELLEREGLAGKDGFHFDFGSRLRLYAANPTGLLSEAELAVVNNSLLTGRLLSDKQFPIAEKLLGGFIEETGAVKSGLVVLNGLPRHAGQAAALEKMVQMKAIIVLDCDSATVLERVRTDAGGDRVGRIDDTIEDVTRKLAIFAKKTLPLVEYYQTRGVPIIRVGVGACSSAQDSRDALVKKLDQISD